MCGRYTLHTEKEALARRFALEVGALDALGSWSARYNIAPTQRVLAVVEREGVRHACLLRWGLVPHWTRADRLPAGWINARAETAASRPAFRDAFARRRCLLLASGFYEWQAPRGAGRHKVPHWISRRDTEPFAMAGLWARWQAPDGETIESCAILTTEANAAVREIHARMPVILRAEVEAPWLSAALDGQTERLRALLDPVPAPELHARAVSTAVNAVRHQGAELIEPADPPELGFP